MLKKLLGDKHSSLFCPNVSVEEKSYIILRLTVLTNKLECLSLTSLNRLIAGAYPLKIICLSTQVSSGLTTQVVDEGKHSSLFCATVRTKIIVR